LGDLYTKKGKGKEKNDVQCSSREGRGSFFLWLLGGRKKKARISLNNKKGRIEIFLEMARSRRRGGDSPHIQERERRKRFVVLKSHQKTPGTVQKEGQKRPARHREKNLF